MEIGIHDLKQPLSFSLLKLPNFILLLTITILFSSHFQFSNASIHTYDRQIFSEVGNSYLLAGGSEAIRASRSSFSSPISTRVVSHSLNDGTSFIRFENITFWRSKEAAQKQSNTEHGSGLVQIVIFEAADRDDIGGSAYGGQRSICCTPDLAKLEGCKQGEVIKIRSSTDKNWPVILNVKFKGRSLKTRMRRQEVYVTKTGMYNLFFISCDSELKGLVMNGKTVWKNPDGYLPGRMAPSMKFYVFMSLAYLVLSSIWFFQYYRFWNEVLQLQHCITAVVVLGLLEMFFWYLDYANFNSTGVRPVVLTTWVVTLGAARRTLSRLLILSLSMGYGVVRPTLGGLTYKVLVIGATYFLATELLNITEYVGTVNDVSGRARILLVLPDSFLDAFLILWIFTSLSKTLEQLQVKRSSVKLDIYRKFSNALAVSVIASVAWIVYEVYFKATDPFNERWQSAWIITAFWDILGFAVLCIICYLWAPSQSSQRYAYSDGVGEEFNDEEVQSLTKGKSGGDVSLVKQGQDATIGGNDDVYDSEEDNQPSKGE
ncbi:transmembrane protein 87B-like [Chenopodium quinoa]|uniref:transmembrane protein 87B-like n=1 Tax=Chenopodium quinoa TaxID=63459 RepID=UPI000B76F26A|nr:transmembrane protein 87B-like [Chenopodium quinoa]